MTSLFATLHVSGSALRAQQLGVQTSGSNVANATTPGYTARRVSLAATSVGPRALGGVEVLAISRQDAPLLRADATRAGVASGYADAKAEALARAESVLAPVGGSRVGRALDDFFSAASALSASPDSQATRQTFLSQAQGLAQAFNRTSADIDALSAGFDKDLTASSARASSLAAEVASLNQRIGSMANAKDQPSALLDRRDAAAAELAGIVGGEVLQDADGNVNVAALGTTIVAGKEAQQISTARNATTGKLDVIATNSAGVKANVTARATAGRLGGIIEVRDRDLAAQKTALDQLATDVQSATNAIHSAGYGLDGVTGRALFNGGTAATMSVDAAVAGNPRAVAAATSNTTLPGDNRAALAMGQLSSQAFALGGTATFSEADRFASVSLAAAAGNANLAHEEAQDARDVADAALSRATGVSIDDEMIHLQEFQRAYQASAKVISVVDEMLQTLVSL